MKSRLSGSFLFVSVPQLTRCKDIKLNIQPLLQRFGQFASLCTTGSCASEEPAVIMIVDETNLFERRSIGRTRITKGALLFLDQKLGISSCSIRDITNLGAGIRVQSLNVLPLIFELSFDNFRTVRACQLVWRQSEFLGVAFRS
jgi:hypothetical protein